MIRSNLDQFFAADIAELDPVIAGAIGRDLMRQRHKIELIASENIVSRAVLQTQESVLRNMRRAILDAVTMVDVSMSTSLKASR